MNNDIWPWFDGKFKAHCNNYEAFRRLSNWKGCEPHGVYDMPDGTTEWDVIIPENLVEKARLLLARLDSSQTTQKPQKPTKGRNVLTGTDSTLSEPNLE